MTESLDEPLEEPKIPGIFEEVPEDINFEELESTFLSENNDYE